jgi:membrane fusion protein (multidrug efflux system)
MTKRMIVMLVVVIAFVAAIGGYKYLQIKKAMSQSYQPPPEAVTTAVAKQDLWDTTISAIGTVVAVNGVTLSADLPGVVDQISFDSGRMVGKGDVLLRQDTKQERAQLASAEAQRELTRVLLARNRSLQAAGIVPKETLDRAAAEFAQAEAAINEIHATIERKTIRAPFAGVLGIRQVNDGQSLASGAPIVSLQALQPVYVNFSVPQREIGLLRTGGAISVTSDSFPGTETGRISAFDSVVNQDTRNIQVQAVFGNASRNLRPGIYVEAQLAQGARTPVVALPVSAISYAPFGDSVFIVEDVKGPDGKSFRGVRQQFVKLGPARGDLVAVLTGVKPGEEVVTSGVFKLRPGAAVVVNNAIQPGASETPKVGNG